MKAPVLFSFAPLLQNIILDILNASPLVCFHQLHLVPPRPLIPIPLHLIRLSLLDYLSMFLSTFAFGT